MTENLPARNNLRLPILLLVMICLLILAGILVLRSFRTPQPVELAEVEPSRTTEASDTPIQTETLTPTPSRTPRPSWTLRPKASATEANTATLTTTSTATRPATITPALPYRYNDLYDLQPWDAEAAGLAADLALGYPDAIFPVERTRKEEPYNAAFETAAFAYREALLRYPEDLRASGWQWRLAYSLARVGDTGAASLYAQLILGGLQQGSLRVQDLSEWFRFYEKNVSLSLYDIPTRVGQLSQKLILLNEVGLAFWLVETPEQARLIPLKEKPVFQSGRKNAHLIADLTGDGLAEVILFEAISTQTETASLQVFALVNDTPIELPIQDTLPVELGTDFQVALESQMNTRFEVKYTTFPACPVTIQQSYQWDGSKFTPTGANFQIVPQPDLLLNCEAVMTHAMNTWQPEITLNILKALLPDWPPPVDAKGRPYPEDARDELRYKIGLYEALTGNQSNALQFFDEVQTSPSDPSNRWILATKQFVQYYQNPEDIYRACQQDPTCDIQNALRQLTKEAIFKNPAEAQEYLRQAGVPIRASGIFDFNNDSEEERWVTIQHRDNQGLEFWILAKNKNGIQVIYVDKVEVDRPQPYFSIVASTPPIFQLEAKRGFRLERLELTGEMYITFTPVEAALTTYTRDALTEAVEVILTGGEARQARDDLEAVLESGRFNCKTHQICDRFFYTLGLAYELSGDERLAVDTYIKLWWENKNSPYTILARLKLKFNPPATSTPRPSRTPTLTPTIGITSNITPSVTSTSGTSFTSTQTPTFEPSPTTSPTSSPTGGTPYP